jgi:hypothetical protein
MSFRSQLIATLRAVEAVLEQPGVLVCGSEVPNLLEPDAAATLVVSQDVDIAVPIKEHPAVKKRLGEIVRLRPSPEEPSVWVPLDKDKDELIEVNFLGFDPEALDAEDTYVLEDDQLPLVVFGPLSLLREGLRLEVQGLTIPLPRRAGLMLEKLVTDRSGVKGDRDLLVVLGLMAHASEAELLELDNLYEQLPRDLRYAACSNLTTLSLLDPIEGMPDPRAYRAQVRDLLQRFEQRDRSSDA